MCSYVRKIQVTGGSTIIVSLPKEWARQYGLTQGSQVYMDVNADGTLIIRPKQTIEKTRRTTRKTIITNGRPPGTIIREIVSLYVAGYDIIDLKYSEEEYSTARHINSVLNRILLGFDVLEEEKGLIRYYVLLDESSIGFWDANNKMTRVVKTMIENSRNLLIKQDKTLAKATIEMDDLVDKLYLLQARKLTQALTGRRPVNELGIPTPAIALYLFLIHKSLERIADHNVIIAKNTMNLKKPIQQAEELAIYLEKTEQTLTQAIKSLQKPNREKLLTASTQIEELRKKTIEIRESIGKKTNHQRIIDSIERIMGYTQDINEAALDMDSILMKASKT